ncbi:MAG: mannan endo-1,4-beta-mannosidase A and B [Clostridia bacterium]|nr:mannan endo-1,4-beta-mannosidase A and B [Clostridia bacterium]
MNYRLSNPDAAPYAVRLFERLTEVYGKKTLTAQQEFPGMGRYDQEMDHIRKITGKLPAVRGLDFMHDDYRGTVERSVKWHEMGGLVSICWHTGLVGKGYRECLDESPDFDELFTPGSELNRLFYRRLDDAADALQQLREKEIPVLWRPFHEFNGKWFWWGKGGSEAFVRLWREMYEHFTVRRGLNNLIWVLGFSGSIDAEWYPGDGYCDIVGSDTYDGVTTNAGAFRLLEKLCPGKMLTFHECGTMPEMDAFVKDEAVWLWMMPWHGEWLLEKNAPEDLLGIYSDARTLTIEDTARWR